MLTHLLSTLALALALASVTLAGETCKQVGGTDAMACTLTKMSDCDAIDFAGIQANNTGPYIVLTCKNTFYAVESIVQTVAKRTGRQSDQFVGSVL